MEPVTKIESVPFHNSEEIPEEVKAPMEAIAEPELLPTLTKEEVPTINSTDEGTLVSKVETKEVISNHIEKNEEKEKDIPTETKREEIIIVENEKINGVLPVTETEENKFVEEVVEKSEEVPQLDETKIIDIKETIPHMEIVTNEIVEVPPVLEMEEEQEKTILVTNMTEVKEIIPEAISPTVDKIEVEKFEPDKFPIVEKVPIVNAIKETIKEPTPILDVKEESLPVDTVMEEKIEIEEPVLIAEDIKTAESPLMTDISKKEQIEVEQTELSPIEDIEKKEDIKALPPILDVAKEEKIEAAELPLITDIAEKEVTEFSVEDMEKKEEIEAVTLPPVADVITEEKIEAEELLLLADAITNEKIEIIPIPTIKREAEEEIEAAEESMLEVEIKKEKDEKMKEEVALPEEVTLPTELPEKKKEEEMFSVETKKILTEVPPSREPTLTNKKEVPVERKKPEVVQIELKIPIAEIKSTEMEMPAIPLEPQLVAQPYLIIAKVKEKQLLQIIPAKQPCTGCYLVSKCYPFYNCRYLTNSFATNVVILISFER